MNTAAIRLFVAVLLITSGFAIAREPSQDALERAHALISATPFLDCEADTELVASYQFSGWQPGPDMEPETELQLLQIVCWLAAYNEVSVFIADNGVTAELLGLPVPMLEIIREADEFEADVAVVDIKGYSTAYTFLNAYVNEEAGLIGEFSRWRGVGDASSTTEWRLKEGRFVLEYFAADATYDSEINPVVIFDYSE